jgi:hypothetical protein
MDTKEVIGWRKRVVVGIASVDDCICKLFLFFWALYLSDQPCYAVIRHQMFMPEAAICSVKLFFRPRPKIICTPRQEN